MNKKKILLSLLTLFIFIIDSAMIIFVVGKSAHSSELFDKIFEPLLGIVFFIVIIIYKFAHKFNIVYKKTVCLIVALTGLTIYSIASFSLYLPLHFKNFEDDIAITYGELTTTKKKSGRIVGAKFLFKTKDEFDFKISKEKFNNEIWTGDCFLAKSRKNKFFLEIKLEQHLDSQSEICMKYNNKLDSWLKEANAKNN